MEEYVEIQIFLWNCAQQEVRSYMKKQDILWCDLVVQGIPTLQPKVWGPVIQISCAASTGQPKYVGKGE